MSLIKKMALGQEQDGEREISEPSIDQTRKLQAQVAPLLVCVQTFGVTFFFSQGYNVK